jgi:menaquinone-dependent protoporphyrinogen oxidase
MRVLTVPAATAPDPSLYDTVIVGSGVRAGAWHPTTIDWIKRHAIALRTKPIAVFSVCLTPVCHPERHSEALGYAMPLTLDLGLRPVASGVFAGVYDPFKVDFRDRVRARLWGAKAGDFTDPGAIEDWAAQVAARLAN